MKKLSVTQFQQLCDAQNYNCYEFHTDDQPGTTVGDPVRISASYHTMRTFLAPASICFKNDQSMLRFIYVKHVLIDRGSAKNHPQFTIICGERETTEQDSSHIICASCVAR